MLCEIRLEVEKQPTANCVRQNQKLCMLPTFPVVGQTALSMRCHRLVRTKTAAGVDDAVYFPYNTPVTRGEQKLGAGKLRATGERVRYLRRVMVASTQVMAADRGAVELVSSGQPHARLVLHDSQSLPQPLEHGARFRPATICLRAYATCADVF